MLSSSGMLKRPRTDYDALPSGLHPAHEMHNYLARDDDRGGHLSMKGTKTIGSAYDRYLQSAKLSSFTSGEASTFGGLGRAVAAMPARPIADPPVMGRPGSAAPDMAPNGQNVGYGSQLPVDAMSRPGRDTVPLPPDASNTLYVEGLPPDSTRREVAHIFRPFVGYKEVRLVSKESRHRGGDPIILCFADFSSPACAGKKYVGSIFCHSYMILEFCHSYMILEGSEPYAGKKYVGSIFFRKECYQWRHAIENTSLKYDMP